MPKNDLPLYFEELKLKEENLTLSLSDLLTQFKQQIPINYLEINLEEGNYGGSTNPKWKNKPLSERYFFTYQEREIQLDLPHSLMNKLGLKKGQDITQSLYLDPKVLDRSETYKGITIQEGEIILVNPHKITLKDQEIQTDLSRDGIKELENTIAKQSKQIQAKDQELAGLRNQLSLWTTTFSNESANQVQTRINLLNSQITQKNTQINSLTSQLNTANSELQKEKDWWDKWINDSNNNTVRDPNDRPFIYAVEDWYSSPHEVHICILLNIENLRRENIDYSDFGKEGFILFRIPIEKEYYTNNVGRGKIVTKTSNFGSGAKQAMKEIYKYYRDK